MLIAYHGEESIKTKYLNRVLAHLAADEIIHGTYWERGKGCAVGCTVHSSSHGAFETELGIPIMLARLEDRIFEGLRNGVSKEFPARFLTCIPVGADLSRVGWQFLHWLLTEELVKRDDPRIANQVKACADVLVPLLKGEPVDQKAALVARDAARKAAREIRAAAAAAAAFSSARSKAFERMADKLIELMSQAPVPERAARAAA